MLSRKSPTASSWLVHFSQQRKERRSKKLTVEILSVGTRCSHMSHRTSFVVGLLTCSFTTVDSRSLSEN